MKSLFPDYYRRFLFTTIVAVYFLIFIGSLVRSTGAGMGCPDWPKCFGLWIPPTCECQLPADYHEKYASHGYANTDFDVFKTWTEYVNRLVGVLIGFFVLVNAVLSVRLRRKSIFLALTGVLVLLITMFQGWLGAVVVDLNLKPVIVSAHLVLASIIVSLLTLQLGVVSFTNNWGALKDILGFRLIRTLSMVLFAAMVIQFVLGVQVRQFVDHLFAIFGYTDRTGFTEQFGFLFYVHRSFSVLVVFLSTWLLKVVLAETMLHSALRTLVVSILSTTILATLVGIILYYFELPTFAQPFHLLTAVLLVGLMVFLNQRLYFIQRLSPVS